MKSRDARSLSIAAKESLRFRAVRAVAKGLTKKAVAEQFGVSRMAVFQWVQRWRQGGNEALKTRRLGRPPGILLSPQQVMTLIRLIRGRRPSQLRLPFRRWTRAAAQQLLDRKFDVQVSVDTVSHYLKLWGLTLPTRSVAGSSDGTRRRLGAAARGGFAKSAHQARVTGHRDRAARGRSSRESRRD